MLCFQTHMQAGVQLYSLAFTVKDCPSTNDKIFKKMHSNLEIHKCNQKYKIKQLTFCRIQNSKCIHVISSKTKALQNSSSYLKIIRKWQQRLEHRPAKMLPKKPEVKRLTLLLRFIIKIVIKISLSQVDQRNKIKKPEKETHMHMET